MIFSLVLMCILIFYFQGFNGVIEFIKNMWNTFWIVLKMINDVSISSTGDSVLVLLFSTTITFAIVGIILEVLSIPKGKFGKWFGKGAFWLIGFPVAFILNIISRLIFN